MQLRGEVQRDRSLSCNHFLTINQNNMSTLKASIFLTQQRADNRSGSLIAHALLHEGSRPYWEIICGSQMSRFIPDPAHILEDGIGILETFIREPNRSIPPDSQTGSPIEIDRLMDEVSLKDFRESLTERLGNPHYAYKLVCWPETDHLNVQNFRESMTKVGINLN